MLMAIYFLVNKKNRVYIPCKRKKELKEYKSTDKTLVARHSEYKPENEDYFLQSSS